jgi:mRNA interferase YafQ
VNRRKIHISNKFKQDFKRCTRRGLKVALVLEVIDLLAARKDLPAKLRDHALAGSYAGHRECHVQSDWLVIYRFSNDDSTVYFVRTGSHADLLGL